MLTAELDRAQQRALSRRAKAHPSLRRIHAGIYSSLAENEWPALIARQRSRVLAALFPGAVIGFNSAFVGGLPVEGVFHLTYSSPRKVQLPGLQVIAYKGLGQQTGDVPIGGHDLYFPSTARMYLENLSQTRGDKRKTATKADVEKRLLTLCESRGEEALGQVRDEARAMSVVLGMNREFATLDKMIGALLGTREGATPVTAKGQGWAAKPLPFDAERLELLEAFAAHLRTRDFTVRPSVTPTPASRNHFAFLESYFSNFIEGTEFEVEEAREFVLENKPIERRPKDSHDVIGVFRQAVSPAWALQTLATGLPVLEQLRARHADQMRSRPEVDPGQFKDQANQAGNTSFVLPRYVRGTLVRGSALLASVEPGFARALFAMFLVAEVHPFADGNGRLARLVMNAELSAVGQCRIIVPTLFREEYLDCLRVLTRSAEPAPFVAAMEMAHAWSAAFDYEDLTETIRDMKRCNAFERSRVQHHLLIPTAGGVERLSMHRPAQPLARP